MVAYMNQEAYEKTLSTGRMHYYSRSRKSLWLKGETSGHFQYVKALKLDCENDTILVFCGPGRRCLPYGSAKSCFFKTLAEKEYKASNPLKVFEDVYGIIED